MLSTHHPKTLLVGAGFSGGGSETRLRMLGRHLFGGSADVAVFNSGLDLDRLGHARVFDLNWSGKASYPGVIVRLRRVLQSGDYDAVMALGLYQNACLTAAAWGLRPRPVILLTETTQPHTNAMDGTSAVVFRLRDVLYRAIYPRADCVAANSMDGCQQIANRYGVPPEHIRRIPNIVDRDYITRLARDDAEFTEHDRPPAKICMVTRLEEM
ncbi:MAG: glycosyltransferase, partial [Pseudomonadota bacterium]